MTGTLAPPAPVLSPTTDALVRAAADVLRQRADLAGFTGDGARVFAHEFPDWPSTTGGLPHGRLVVRAPLIPAGTVPVVPGGRSAYLVVRGEVARLASGARGYDARRYLARMVGLAQLALQGSVLDLSTADVPATVAPLRLYREMTEPEADGADATGRLRCHVTLATWLTALP